MHIPEMAASDLYVPDSYEGIMPLQVDDAGGDDEANSQEPIKSKTTTEQTSNIERKKKKKKKRTRASLDGAEEGQAGINRPGQENQAVDDEEQLTLKAEEAKVAASSTPLEGVADMNKSNTKSQSSSSKGIKWSENDEIVILCGLISCKENKGEYDRSKECYAYIRSLLKQGDLKQIKDKVKSLKRKYKNCKAKNMEEGSHEMKLFKLSNIYWGKLEEEKEKDETVLVQPEEKDIADVEMTSKDGEDEKEKEKDQTVLVQPGEKEIVDVEMTSKDGDDEKEKEKDETVLVQPEETDIADVEMTSKDGEDEKEKEKDQAVLVQPGEKEIVDVEMTSKNGDDEKEKEKDETVLVEPGEKEIVDVDMSTLKDGDDESKPKISGVLRRGLGDYFQSQGFDHRWVEEQELEDLENKWKTYKIAEAKSDMAQAHFLKAFNTYTLQAYKTFGYQND